MSAAPKYKTQALLPLYNRPTIHQAGMGEHGMRIEETYFRPNLWALHLYFWEGKLSFGGVTYEVKPHNLGLTPPSTDLTWQYPMKTCRHYFVHFEYQPASNEQTQVQIPYMVPLENDFKIVRQRFERVIQWDKQHPIEADVALWDLLWLMSDLGKDQAPKLAVRPGSLETAMGIVENELDEHLNAQILADRIGISYTHLNRLFKERLNTTVSKYIAQERYQRAGQLLRKSNLSIKAIAERVGFSSSQHFNKFMRQQCGLSPSRYRAEHSELNDASDD